MTRTRRPRPPCDKCGRPNARHAEGNYCGSCRDNYQARISADPETRPVGSPSPADERRRELERQAERDLASLDYAGGRFWTAADQD